LTTSPGDSIRSSRPSFRPTWAHIRGRVLKQLDQIAGKPPKTYNTTALQAQLKMLTRRLGNLGFPFDDNKQTIGALGRELTIVRNTRAHGDPFTRRDASRAHDLGTTSAGTITLAGNGIGAPY
jgi:hypothetical protein